ncbi:MAG: hypothetical protein ACAH83_18345 [Alphaproteobacteria bacterium]
MRLLYAIGCAAILTMLGGCGTASRGDFCSIYRPVYTSAADTAETKDQADDNNALWLALCGGGYAP